MREKVFSQPVKPLRYKTQRQSIIYARFSCLRGTFPFVHRQDEFDLLVWCLDGSLPRRIPQAGEKKLKAVVHPKMVLISAALLAMFFAVPAHAQGAVQKSSSTMEDKLAQSYRAMYDLKFQEAFKAVEEAQALSQDDPLPCVAQAWVAFFRELDRLHALRSEVFSTDDN